MKGVSLLARSAAGLSVALALTAAATIVAVPRQTGALEQATDLLFCGWSLCFAPVGLLILSKRPGNRIGWVSLGLALTIAATALLVALSRALGGRETGPGLELVLLSDIGWVAMMTMLAWFLLLFPDGRLPSRRWRPLAVGLAAWPPLFLVTALLAPMGMQGGTPAPNPFGGIGGAVGDVMNFVLRILLFMLLPLLAGVAFASITRFLGSHGVERQQLKWVAYSAGLIAFCILVSAIFPTPAVDVLTSLSFQLLPIAVAVAILRYRLYDVDLLINRTLVYGATSAAIGATFFVGIVALQAFLQPLTSGSEIPVAASTLASFALFQPIRRRVQDAVDHRFDRSRYDAARTLDAFADRLRDEVDLDAVRSDLLSAVERTMGPAHASIWLRERAR